MHFSHHTFPYLSEFITFHRESLIDHLPNLKSIDGVLLDDSSDSEYEGEGSDEGKTHLLIIA